jgi:hypothetical protein
VPDLERSRWRLSESAGKFFWRIATKSYSVLIQILILKPTAISQLQGPNPWNLKKPVKKNFGHDLDLKKFSGLKIVRSCTSLDFQPKKWLTHCANQSRHHEKSCASAALPTRRFSECADSDLSRCRQKKCSTFVGQFFLDAAESNSFIANDQN